MPIEIPAAGAVQPDPPPVPGFDGTYRDTCVGCYRPTDTGLAFQGDAEWAIAGLLVLGVEEEAAPLMVRDYLGCDPGTVPVGTVTMAVRACSACAGHIPVGLIATGIPVIEEVGR